MKGCCKSSILMFKEMATISALRPVVDFNEQKSKALPGDLKDGAVTVESSTSKPWFARSLP